MSARKRLVPDNFTDKGFLVCDTRPCPICGKPDWCRSDGATWALCHRIESLDRWKNAGWLHRLGGAGSVPPAPPTSRAAAAKPKAEDRKIWPSLEVAAAEFDRLPLAREDAAALDLFQKDYGLAPGAVPGDWRIIVHKRHRGIVYRGGGIDGKPCAYKYRSIDRDATGKRFAFFLAGSGGVLIFPASDPGAAVVVCAGEEKGAAANVAGFHALSPLTGEKQLSAEWIAFLREHPRTVILAADNDPAGLKANQDTAAVLEAAGLAPALIRVVQWPADAPKGYDLNDHLKAQGVEGLRALLDAAPAIEDRLPRCLSVRNFLAVPRDPLAFHIDGVLPYSGKLTFSATSKFGKSMWAIQTGLALASGNCEWLGWKFGPPCRVLYFQAEISDPLVSSRLAAIIRQIPAQIDRERAVDNFIVQEIAKQRPNLLEDEGRAIAEALIERHKPIVLILDPLAAICPGMEENDAGAMSLTLGYFSELTRRFGCAVVLIHHHGKAAVSRGSSVYEAWPESDLSASFLEPEDHTVAKVEMRLRCVFNRGPVYWRTPSEASLWFDLMPGDWQPEKRGPKPKAGIKHVVLALKAAGAPLSWTTLVREVQDICSCGERTAETAVKEARETGRVKVTNGCYVLP